MPPRPPTISAILPALNEESNILHALKSVADADERIVVDGGSRDQTPKLARGTGCRVLHTPPGRGGQLRAGVSAATGDVLLFLHADSWLAEGGITQLRTHLKHAPRAFGAFRQRIDDSRWRFRGVERGNALRVTWLKLPYGDQAMFVDRRTYVEVGGFQDVPLMEDVMLARALGKRVTPVLLAGPVHVNARRWQQHGVVRQTLCNWLLLTSFFCGVTPAKLARWYRRS